MLQRKFTTISQKHYPDLSRGIISSDVISLGDQWCCHRFLFRKQWLPLLTVDASIGYQAFSHNRCNIFLGLSYNDRQILSTTKKCLRKKSEPPAGIKTHGHNLPDTGPQHFLSCTYVISTSSQLGGWLIRQMI